MSTNKSPRVSQSVFSLTALLAAILVALVSLAVFSCASGNPPAAAKPAPGTQTWIDFELYLSSPDDLNATQKQLFQNYAAAAPAFVAGMQFSNAGISQELRGTSDLSIRGLLIRQTNHRDGLAIWHLEGQMAVSQASRNATIAQTISVEVSTRDPELAGASASGQYPATRLLVVMANRAIREAVRAGHSQGSIRLAQLQYDSQLGRFRAKFEIF